MATDLFNNDQSKQTNVQPDALKELVGEGKKFKTVEDLAKGKVEADAFVEQLKTEQAALRKQLEELDKKAKEGATLKDLMDKLDIKPNSDGNNGNQPALNQDEVKKLVLNTVEQREKELQRTGNRAAANDTLLQKFSGDAAKATAYLDSRAKDLGLTREALGELSETSPSAFAQLLGLQVQGNQSRATIDLKSTNTEALFPQTTGAKDASFYVELKKKDQKQFWSPRVQQELFKYGKDHGMDALNKILYG